MQSPKSRCSTPPAPISSFKHGKQTLRAWLHSLTDILPQPTKDIDPRLWTLRFKQHKSTVLLFVEQNQLFTSIKADLLEALKKSGHTELNGQVIPTDPEDVVFGVPVDKNDIAKGWVGLDIPDQEEEDDAENRKKAGRENGVLNASPLGAGLKDGAMLAFKFLSEDAKMDGDGLDLDDSNWDVIIPSYEEESASQS